LFSTKRVPESVPGWDATNLYIRGIIEDVSALRQTNDGAAAAGRGCGEVEASRGRDSWRLVSCRNP